MNIFIKLIIPFIDQRVLHPFNNINKESAKVGSGLTYSRYIVMTFKNDDGEIDHNVNDPIAKMTIADKLRAKSDSVILQRIFISF